VEALFEAVLAGEAAVRRLLKNDPASVAIRATREQLVQEVPHQLYSGDTGLHLAAAGLWPGIVRLLIEAGADPKAANRRGATPLHYACDPRPVARKTSDADDQAAVIDLLADHGADLNKEDVGGAAPLHRAVRARSVSAVRQLLRRGADPGRRLGKRGSTPLHLAVRSTGASGTAGHLPAQLEIVALLLEHHADPEAADAAGRTPRDAAPNEAILRALSEAP
jgi:ankyrin repeat protein